MELLFGTDPLCGWCYGNGPAIRRVIADHPGLKVRPVLGGLVSGTRVGPYTEMEGYIRNASKRLSAVTGRTPSDAFFEMIARPSVIGNSGPPSIAIGAVRLAYPDHVLDFVLRITDSHFALGADLNDPQTYTDILGEMGLSVNLPDFGLVALAEAEWKIGRSLGLGSYPSLWLRADRRLTPITVDYDPARLSDQLRGLVN
jgi:putative protein-disulfide isomerase